MAKKTPAQSGTNGGRPISTTGRPHPPEAGSLRDISLRPTPLQKLPRPAGRTLSLWNLLSQPYLMPSPSPSPFPSFLSNKKALISLLEEPLSYTTQRVELTLPPPILSYPLSPPQLSYLDLYQQASPPLTLIPFPASSPDFNLLVLSFPSFPRTPALTPEKRSAILLFNLSFHGFFSIFC